MPALLWGRHLALLALTLGLLASPDLRSPAGWEVLVPAACLLLAVLRPAARGGRAAAGAWLALLGLTAALAGLGLGQLRVGAIASGAASGPVGPEVIARGHVAAPARISFGELRLPLQTADGRLMVVQRRAQPGAVPRIGEQLRVRGRLAEPEPWRATELERLGVSLELRARAIEPLPGERTGIAGLLDDARGRAERGVDAGLDPQQAALARGFVLGQDEAIDPRTREEFRRSGLAHLLSCYERVKTSALAGDDRLLGFTPGREPRGE